MNDDLIREKFFELWSGQLSKEEESSVREYIFKSELLTKQYNSEVKMFESLRGLKVEAVSVPENFTKEVLERTKKRSALSKILKVFRGVGYSLNAGIFLFLAASIITVSLFLYFQKPSNEYQLNFGDRLLGDIVEFIEGRGGLILFLVMTLYALFSLPLRSYRCAALSAVTAMALFFCRSAITMYFNTDGLYFYSEGDTVDQVAIPSPSVPVAGSGLSVKDLLIEKKAKVSAQLERVPADGAIGVGQQEMGGVGDLAFLPQENREAYGSYEENPRVSVKTEPVSTFSMDVDTGSYSNIRRFLRLGQLPPKEAVRIEELINYFPYEYEAPTKDPFAAHFEVAPSPFSKGRYLLKIGLKAKAAPMIEDRGWNLVFLVDTSGSMEDQNKLPLVKQSLKLLTDSMRAEDRIALVTYAGNAGIVLASTSGREKAKIRSAIDSLGAGGSTNGEAGIELAYNQAEKNKIEGSVNRVILATDGDFNVGISDFDQLISLIEKKRKTGISLTTLGFGTGNYQERSMEQLADKGNGNYFYIDSFQEAKKVLSTELTQAMETVAKDAKIQIEFNPQRVKEYRLIGYDNRMLKNEDFKNDAVDAGEVGSGHTVTALYEIELSEQPVADSAVIDHRYQKAEKTSSGDESKNELAFLKIRAKDANGNTSTEYSFPVEASVVKQSIDDASEDFRFTAAVAGFGSLLRDSKYADKISWETVRNLAEKSRGQDPFGYRNEFLGLIDAAKGIK